MFPFSWICSVLWPYPAESSVLIPDPAMIFQGQIGQTSYFLYDSIPFMKNSPYKKWR